MDHKQNPCIALIWAPEGSGQQRVAKEDMEENCGRREAEDGLHHLE